MLITGGTTNSQVQRTQAAAYDQKYPVTSFIRDTLFAGAEPSLNEYIDLDIRRGNDRVAAFVAPGVGGIDMQRTGHTVVTFTPPRIAPERSIDPSLLTVRAFGEQYHSSISPADRATAIMQRDMTMLDDAITRREELMCAQVLSTGTVSVRGYSDENKTTFVDNNIATGFTGITTLLTTDRWSETSTANPLQDLEDECTTLGKAGVNPTMAILGAEAFGYLKNDATFLARLDNLNYNVGNMMFDRSGIAQGQGVMYAGRIASIGLDLYVYLAWYTDVDGTQKAIFPSKRVTICGGPVGTVHYGAVTQLEEDKLMHTYVDARVQKILTNVNNDTIKLRLTSRPLPLPWDVLSWRTIVVATE